MHHSSSVDINHLFFSASRVPVELFLGSVHDSSSYTVAGNIYFFIGRQVPIEICISPVNHIHLIFTSEAAGLRTQKPLTAAVKAVRLCAQNQKN